MQTRALFRLRLGGLSHPPGVPHILRKCDCRSRFSNDLMTDSRKFFPKNLGNRYRLYKSNCFVSMSNCQAMPRRFSYFHEQLSVYAWLKCQHPWFHSQSNFNLHYRGKDILYRNRPTVVNSVHGQHPKGKYHCLSSQREPQKMNDSIFTWYFAFRDFFQRCKFSVTQGEILWLFPGLEVINFGLSFPYLCHLYLKLSYWRQTTISFWNGFLMTIKTMKDRRHPLSISLSPKFILKILVVKMFRAHYCIRCYSQVFILIFFYC